MEKSASNTVKGANTLFTINNCPIKFTRYMTKTAGHLCLFSCISKGLSQCSPCICFTFLSLKNRKHFTIYKLDAAPLYELKINY